MNPHLSRSHLLRREFWLQLSLPLGVRIAPAIGSLRGSASGAPAQSVERQAQEVRHG